MTTTETGPVIEEEPVQPVDPNGEEHDNHEGHDHEGHNHEIGIECTGGCPKSPPLEP
jgi:hypothetical protein